MVQVCRQLSLALVIQESREMQHCAIEIHLADPLSADGSRRRQPDALVIFVTIIVLPAVSTRGYVVACVAELDAEWSGHGLKCRRKMSQYKT